MSTTTDESVRLLRWEISQFMRIECQTVEADGRHVIISGPNGSGKTSSVDAIWLALGGKRSVPEPVHHGAAEAVVRLDLGAYTVERHWSAEGGTKLIVMAADGSKINQPGKLVEGLLAEYALNPLEFLRRRPQDQVNDVLSVTGVKPPEDAVANILEETVPAKPGQSAYDYLDWIGGDTTGELFVRRRVAGSLLDKKRAALQEQRQILEKLGGRIPDNFVPGTVSSVAERIAALNEQRTARDQAAQDYQDSVASLTKSRESLAELKKQHRDSLETIERLQREAKVLLGRITKGDVVIAELEEQEKEDAAKLASLPDPTPEIAKLTEAAKQVEANAAAFQKRRHAHDQLERIAKEVQHAQAEHKKVDDQLAAVRELRANLLNGVELGVEGLTIGDGELRYHGVPFRQASTAESLRVACAVAMRENPKLKLLRIDQGELLDDHSRAVIFDMANREGWQVLMTAVSNGDGLKVEIVEGAHHG